MHALSLSLSDPVVPTSSSSLPFLPNQLCCCVLFSYVFERASGKFLNITFGGKGDRTQHGKFATNHGCTYDPRFPNTIAVSDRANSRIEYFTIDNNDPTVFKYLKTHDLRPVMGPKVCIYFIGLYD